MLVVKQGDEDIGKEQAIPPESGAGHGKQKKQDNSNKPRQPRQSTCAPGRLPGGWAKAVNARWPTSSAGRSSGAPVLELLLPRPSGLPHKHDTFPTNT
jgi:hypothetical protein